MSSSVVVLGSTIYDGPNRCSSNFSSYNMTVVQSFRVSNEVSTMTEVGVTQSTESHMKATTVVSKDNSSEKEVSSTYTPHRTWTCGSRVDTGSTIAEHSSKGQDAIFSNLIFLDSMEVLSISVYTPGYAARPRSWA